MPKKMMLIVNPLSGKGQAKTALFQILSQFNKAGYAVTVFISDKKGDTETFAREYSDEYELIVCIGGDGTFSDVTNGLMHRSAPPPVGYIPMGTANDVARSLGISKVPKTAAAAILKGKPMPLDIGVFDDRFFTYIAAFGAFTEVSYSTPQDAKRSLGHLAYVLEGLSLLPTLAPEHVLVEYDEGTIEGDFIFGAVTNSTSVAGVMRLDARDVSFRDGLFEVLLIRNPLKLTELNAIITNILTRNYNSENVTLLHTGKVRFRFGKEVAWTLDGENGGTHRDIVIENRQEALQIML